MPFAVDSNRNISAIRTGAIIGGFYNPTPSGFSNNLWYRLMPMTDSAAKVADNPTAIDLGALRSELLDTSIMGWNLRILTSGYEAHYTIAEYDSTSEIAQLNIYDGSGNIQDHIARLPATFDVVYYPQMLLPLTINYNMSTTTTNSNISKALDIGYVVENTILPLPRPLVSLSSGDQLILPIQEIDKIFFRFPVSSTGTANAALDDTADVFSISWGEHYTS